jgi:hypothetical protein
MAEGSARVCGRTRSSLPVAWVTEDLRAGALSAFEFFEQVDPALQGWIRQNKIVRLLVRERSEALEAVGLSEQTLTPTPEPAGSPGRFALPG